MAPLLKMKASAPLISAVGDAEPELLEDEEGVTVTVLFEGVLDELAIAVAEVVVEGVADAVPPLTLAVVDVPVMVADEDPVLDGSEPKSSMVPTE